MKKSFSTKWKSSTQVRKQRKYRHNAPLHIKNKFMGSHLSKDLREKHKKKTLPVRIGDRVKVMRGKFKGNDAKVERVVPSRNQVFLEKIRVNKKDGSEVAIPLSPSNLMIISLSMEDKLRLKEKKVQKKKEKKVKETKQEKKAEVKAK
jgi:large subunit ribosomal protein L24